MPNSKRKGNKFERAVSKWFTEFSGYQFSRVPYSGAIHNNKDLASDVMCSDEKHAHRCKISIECKNYKDIKFEHVLLGTKGAEIVKFWNQAYRDAQRSKKIPILCIRYNSMPKSEFFFIISPILLKAFQVNGLDHDMTLSSPDIEGRNLFIFMASEVKANVNYKQIHKLAKQACKSIYK